MIELRARVRRGRLVLDEPTELPEGAEVGLALADSAGIARREASTRSAVDALTTDELGEENLLRGDLPDGLELIAQACARHARGR